MEIIDVPQGSDEWQKLRIASIGGTAIGKIAPQKKQYQDMLYKFAGELITGVKAESFKFQHADRGTEFEPEARDYYSLITGTEVEQVGIIKEGSHKHVSPDGLIGDDGYLEIKTRIPAVFVQAYEERKLDINVRRQVQWGLFISQRKWADICQYCPEMANAGANPLIIDRVQRDEKLIAELNQIADKFLAEMFKLVDRIRLA